MNYQSADTHSSREPGNKLRKFRYLLLFIFFQIGKLLFNLGGGGDINFYMLCYSYYFIK